MDFNRIKPKKNRPAKKVKPTANKKGKATDRLKKINSGNSKFSKQPK